MLRRRTEDRALVGRGGGRGRETRSRSPRIPARPSCPRRAHLSNALCRGLVDGDPMGGDPPRRHPEAVRTDLHLHFVSVLELKRVVLERRITVAASSVNAHTALFAFIGCHIDLSHSARVWHCIDPGI